MGQYKSYLSSSLEQQVIRMEQDLVEMKAKQFYNPQQMNYAYKSNVVDVDAYHFVRGTEIYGVAAKFVFTSQLQDVLPLVCIENVNEQYRFPFLTNYRVSKRSANQIEIYVVYVDTVVSFSAHRFFVLSLRVNSNTAGTLALEATYDVPNT